MKLQRLSASTPGHQGLLEEIILAAPAYSLLIENRLPTLQDAEELLRLCPPGLTADDKFVFTISQGAGTLGCVDLVRGYPTPETAFLGLLLLKESEQGKGLGGRVLGEIMALAASWGCTRLRLAVIETNTPALRFWIRHGFEQQERKAIAGFTGDTLLLERAVCHSSLVI